jgi:predicted acylesterase/phospholipase RssA
MFQVVNRCFQIMQAQTEANWRRHSDLVISPDVCGVAWDGFASAEQLIEAGERAALEALPQIRQWLRPSSAKVDPAPQQPILRRPLTT